MLTIRNVLACTKIPVAVRVQRRSSLKSPIFLLFSEGNRKTDRIDGEVSQIVESSATCPKFYELCLCQRAQFRGRSTDAT